ncbi:hypothetical protein BGW37DRAFT_509155 [Umbelopsis sp. PMI_123]|nr:hypothetical protein BGW37DRAFT_509155 [Umbelopsis sp. PMI_123]
MPVVAFFAFRFLLRFEAVVLFPFFDCSVISNGSSLGELTKGGDCGLLLGHKSNVVLKKDGEEGINGDDNDNFISSSSGDGISILGGGKSGFSFDIRIVGSIILHVAPMPAILLNERSSSKD